MRAHNEKLGAAEREVDRIKKEIESLEKEIAEASSSDSDKHGFLT